MGTQDPLLRMLRILLTIASRASLPRDFLDKDRKRRPRLVEATLLPASELPAKNQQCRIEEIRHAGASTRWQNSVG